MLAPKTNIPPFAGKVLGGWEFTGITTLHTGFPLNDSIGTANCNSSLFNSCRPDLIGKIVSNGNGINSPKWTRSGVFSYRALVGGNPHFGNAPPEVLWGNGYNDFDLGFLKQTKITERYNLEFRWETFNTWNHTNPNNPTSSVDSGTFGTTLSAQGAREMQFALKLSW